MDRFEAMSLLLKVVDAGSFSAAARQLDIPLPTVSRHIAELEAHIGAKILIRSPRKLGLTEIGTTYVESVRQLLDQLQDIESAAAGAYAEPKGVLTMTAPIVMGRTHLVPLVTEFLDAHPQIDVRLHLADQILPITERKFDVALRVGDLPDSALIATEIGQIRRVTVVSPAYLEKKGRPQAPEDLRHMCCVTFDNLAGIDAWRFQTEESGKTTVKTVPIHSRLVVNTAEAALEAVERGLGYTRLLSYQVSESVADHRTCVVLTNYEMRAWPVSLVYHGRNLIPQKLTAFLNYITPRLRARLASEAALFERISADDRPAP